MTNESKGLTTKLGDRLPRTQPPAHEMFFPLLHDPLSSTPAETGEPHLPTEGTPDKQVVYALIWQSAQAVIVHP
jgi:hypothetical protein